jgi:hypothetical protein
VRRRSRKFENLRGSSWIKPETSDMKWKMEV